MTPGADGEPAAGGPAPVEALCHLSCRLLERPLRLRPDREITVGRDAGNDIRVPTRLVSRRHGRFFPEKGVWVYADLDSSNGSRVNGEPTERAVLRTGDVVEVGGVPITYREVHDLADLDAADDGTTQDAVAGLMRRAVAIARAGGGKRTLGGTLADLPIEDVLLLLQRGRKTGALALDFGGSAGWILVRDGEMVHAEYGRWTGEDAVGRMFLRVSGTFLFDPRDPGAERTIRRPTTAVLMDAARAADERRRG